MPVVVLGLSSAPNAGDELLAVRASARRAKWRCTARASSAT